MKPGASVHAAIITEIYKAATVVPVAAILPGEEGGTAVLTVTPDSVAHKKKVELGIREGGKVQILNGVRPGEEVVIVGGMGVDDKAKVKNESTRASRKEDDDDNAPSPTTPEIVRKTRAKQKSEMSLLDPAASDIRNRRAALDGAAWKADHHS